MRIIEYKNYHPGITAPPARAVAIIPDDDNDLEFVSRGIYVASGGDIKVNTLFGDIVIFKNVPGQNILIGQYTRIYATGTTASDMVILA